MTVSLAQRTANAPWALEYRQVVKDWLQGCGIAYPTADKGHIDDEFHRMCYDAAAREGYPVDEASGISRYLSLGINIATTNYGHLPDVRTRVWIALYTAYMAASDDTFAENVAPVQDLFQRMLSGEKQAHPFLDAIVSVLRKTPEHFDAPQDMIILTSSLNFIASLSVDDMMRSVELPPCAEAYARWISLFNGANEAYTMFAFPREVPFQAYAHAIPDMMSYVRDANDILSFYKEEMAGENGNHVSLVAQCRKISKLDAVKAIADGSAAAHLRAMDILVGHPVAQAAWLSAAAGYVAFHTTSKRYRLDELHFDA